MMIAGAEIPEWLSLISMSALWLTEAHQMGTLHVLIATEGRLRPVLVSISQNRTQSSLAAISTCSNEAYLLDRSLLYLCFPPNTP
jgi:hypothetical protein